MISKPAFLSLEIRIGYLAHLLILPDSFRAKGSMLQGKQGR